jgi:phosphatidylinositol-3-phosphatase
VILGARFSATLMVLTFFSTCAVAQVPRSTHVWILSEENHSYENVLIDMPYLVSLSNQYAASTEYYADMHNSIATLMHLVAGQTVTTNNVTTLSFDVDNLVRVMLPRGLTFKSYQEGLPYAGFLDVEALPYVKRHNPLAYFTDVANSSLKYNIVPYSDLAGDIAAHRTGNLNYITPNLDADAHDGTMQVADAWLKGQIPVILSAPEFQPGGDGILFIVFDEGNVDGTDNRCSATVSQGCGGRVLTAVIGPSVKRGLHSATWHNHESLLKTVCQAFATASCPGAAAAAVSMSEVFSAGTATAGIAVSSPAAGTVGLSPVLVEVAATAPAGRTITFSRIYVDNVSQYATSASNYSTNLSLLPGAHYVVAQAWDNTGAVYKAPVTIGVAGVVVASPAPASTVGQISQWSASALAPAGSMITAMQIYVENQLRYAVKSTSLNTALSMSPGKHNVVVQAWDNLGTVYKTPVIVTVN